MRSGAAWPRRGVTVVSGMALGIDARGARRRAGGRRADDRGAGRRGRSALPAQQDGAVPPDRGRRRLRGVRDAAGLHAVASGAFRRATGSSPALAAATIVVEAAERSGSLITAEIAQDLGRVVAAVPGPVTTPHVGGHQRAAARRRRSSIRDAQDALDARARRRARGCVAAGPASLGSADRAASAARPPRRAGRRPRPRCCATGDDVDGAGRRAGRARAARLRGAGARAVRTSSGGGGGLNLR